MKNQVLLLPGLGADHRLCTMLLPLPGEVVTPDFIPWQRHESLAHYSQRLLSHLILSRQIDPKRLRVIVGISLGGAIAQEMSTALDLDAVVLVGSFTSARELAPIVRVALQSVVPLLPDVVFHLATPLVPSILSGISRVPSYTIELLLDMYRGTPKHFVQRASSALCGWSSPAGVRVIRIHGAHDHIVPPVASMRIEYLVKGAKHLVSVARTDEVRSLLTLILSSVT